MFKYIVALGFITLLGCEPTPDLIEPAKRGARGESCLATNDCDTDLVCITNVCALGDFRVSPQAKFCLVVECEGNNDCFNHNDDCIEAREDCDDSENPESRPCLVVEQCNKLKCQESKCVFFCGNDDDCQGATTCVEGQCAECQENSDCPDGNQCRDGQCSAICEADRECPLFHGCDSGECVETGCTSDRECKAVLSDGSALCRESQCRVPCQRDAQCVMGSGYNHFACAGGFCEYVGCESDDECRAAVYGSGPLPAGVQAVTCMPGEPSANAGSVSLPMVPAPQLEEDNTPQNDCDPREGFRCEEGAEPLPCEFLCDGAPQCENESDEANCF